MPRGRRLCVVCDGTYLGDGRCVNFPNCPRLGFRQRQGHGALMAARRRWAVNVRARALWRKVRFAFWTGVVYRYACYHFEDALCRIRCLEVFGIRCAEVFGRLTLGDATLEELVE